MTSAACNSLFTFFSPLQSCQIVPERARALLPPYWSGAFSFPGKDPNPYTLTVSQSCEKRRMACAPEVIWRHWVKPVKPKRLASLRSLFIAPAKDLESFRGSAKRGLFGKRFLHAERISPCAAGNQIITPVSSLPALPSGKLPRQHSAMERRPFNTRSVVFVPTCFSKPVVGKMLKRTTTSCASMYFPYGFVIK